MCLTDTLLVTAPLSALATDTGIVEGAKSAVFTLGTASAPEAEVGLAPGVVLAELVELGETTTGALAVDAETTGATLVLVAASASWLNLLASALAAERATDTLVRLSAEPSVGDRLVGNTPSADAVTRSTTGVLVASVAVLLDVLAVATVAVRVGLALVVRLAVEAVLSLADLGDTLALAARTGGAVVVTLASRARSSGRRGGSVRGNGGRGSLTTLEFYEGGGDVLEHLTVDKVS